MFTYILITLGVIIAPFALSFDKKVGFYHYWKPLLISIIPVSAVFIVWDVIVTEQGHWSFNSQYSGVVTILGLPLGEWLFFFVVPYASIFIYEVVRAYFPYKKYNHSKGMYLLLISIAIIGVILFFSFFRKGYSRLAVISVSIYISIALFLTPDIFREIHTLWFFIFSIGAFFIVNSILTALPVVLYNSDAIWRIRVFTIPLEDFFYNTSLLGLYLTSYLTCKKVLLPQ